MNRIRFTTIVAAVVALVVGIGSAFAEDGDLASRTELSVAGGIQALNKNDTALPDQFINIPAVATLSYHLNPILAVEGEFTWMIPVRQSVDLGASGSQDRKTPDVLAYQGNLRASWPVSGTTLTPYAAAGAGAVTFLSNTDPDRLPVLDQSQTMFAINFGAGANYGLTSHWALRGDFREFAAFPSKDATGLSSGNSADPIWMERGTLGVAYRF
jgi:opacity protein-like surface antigen